MNKPSPRKCSARRLNRRRFLWQTAVGLGVSGRLPYWVAGGAGSSFDPMQRVAMTTVTFRARFAQTRIPGHPPEPELTLLEVPEFYADRFHVHNLEFWSLHFESQSDGYIQDLRDRIGRAQARLVNIQIDEPYNLAAEDASEREAARKLVRQWIDLGVSLGAQSVRANTGNGDIQVCIESFRELLPYARDRGILLLTENHGGLSSDPDHLVRIHRAVGPDGFQLLPDFGNFPDAIRYEGLRKILPYAKHLISAKTFALNADWEHPAFDFDRCMRIARESGFPGYYSAEHYDSKATPTDYEKVADWMIKHIVANLARG